MALRCDLILRDATIIDGTGAPRTSGDVGVTGDRIVATGDLSAASADRDVIATGKIVSPGFIDAHTHDDWAVLCGPSCMTCKMSQGVTTVVVGNCGISPAPIRFTPKTPPLPPLGFLANDTAPRFGDFADYAEALRKAPPPVNTYALIGHMTLRMEAMQGDTQRAATDAEAGAMQARLRDALAQGASGFSTGLYYPPSTFAPTDEVIAVAEALREAGGIYVTHMRNEGPRVIDSIEETLKIGRDTGTPIVISHHKCTFPENFGRSRETLALIDKNARTQDVAFDVYPYAASSTALMLHILRDDVKVRVTWSIPHPECAGRWLHELAAAWGLTNKQAAERLLPAGAIYYQMDEADVQRILAHDLGMIGSDGIPNDKFPHPRLWGTFPRVLGHYARDLNLFSLETAVHKMTGRPAKVFGMIDRGTIRPGAYADLVLFDAATIRDTATFETPIQPAEGILETWVNGQSAYHGGAGVTGARAGRLVSRNQP